MTCKARRYGDQMQCECGLAWDINDPEPPVCQNGTKTGRWSAETPTDVLADMSHLAPVIRRKRRALRADLPVRVRLQDGSYYIGAVHDEIQTTTDRNSAPTYSRAQGLQLALSLWTGWQIHAELEPITPPEHDEAIETIREILK